MWKIIRRPLEIAELDTAGRAVGDAIDRVAFRLTRSTARDVSRPDPAALPCPFFIVLAPYRSGTNLLIRSMNDLEGCMVFNELFNPKTPLFGPPVLTELNQDPALTRERDRDPLGFLERRVLTQARPGMRALGFKLMYEEARWGRLARVRRWLARHRSIRVVHLVRRNVLEQLISWRICLQNKQWVVATKPDPKRPHEAAQKPIPSLRLNALETRLFFRHVERRQAEARRLQATHPFLEITYEDLSERFAETMARVQGFLELPGEAPAPATQKMTTKRPAEIVQNFAALKRRMEGTRWAGWF